MRHREAIALLAALLMSGNALGACQLGQLVQLPVTMVGLRPTVPVQIDGADALFAIDSGAFFGFITPAAAQQFHLPLGAGPDSLHINGIGGPVSYAVARVAHFRLGGVDLRGMDFVVAGNQLGAGVQGILGENILDNSDVEYDFAAGTLRLMRPRGCSRADLAYWDKDGRHSVLDLDFAGPLSAPHATAYLNGRKIQVMFDTGSPTSLLSLRAARRAGFSPTGPDATAAGYTYGAGKALLPTWIGSFASFKLGAEEIRNARLRVADLSGADADMLIGTDFFLAHRLYVANSQHRIYFTYNGGPVFNLTPTPRPPPAGAPAAVVGAASPADAAAVARQGAALAARGEYAQAIALLTRAHALDPGEPGYLEQRGRIEQRLGERDQALADFDQTLELKADDIGALVARASLRLAGGDRTGAAADALALEHALPKESDLRLTLAALYVRLDQYAAAAQAYGDWLDAHRDDIAAAVVLGSRCWARAMADEALPAALGDCNRAVRGVPTTADRAAALDSRALVRLRLGDYARSIRDYDGALAIAPTRATSLYGRGIDEIRQGRIAPGQADLHAAATLRPEVADIFRSAGITP